MEECGVDKVRLTEGSRCFVKISSITADIKRLDGLKDLGITTNGILLKGDFDLLHAGVNFFTVSLDTLDEEKFARITKRRGCPRARSFLRCRISALSLKVNCVVMGVNDDETSTLSHGPNTCQLR